MESSHIAIFPVCIIVIIGAIFFISVIKEILNKEDISQDKDGEN